MSKTEAVRKALAERRDRLVVSGRGKTPRGALSELSERIGLARCAA